MQRALSTGFEQYGITIVQKTLHQGHDFPLLQHRFAAGDLDQSARTQHLDLCGGFFHGHAMTAGESVFAVAPRATQIASGEAHEHARQARMRGFTLDRFVNLSYLHGEQLPVSVADFKVATAYSL